MINTEAINAYLDWFCDDFSLLLDKQQEALETHKEIIWPPISNPPNFLEVEFTIRHIAHVFNDGLQIKCSLVNLVELDTEDSYIDDFFVRGHIFGHLLLKHMKIPLDESNIYDIGHMEFTSTIFSILLARRYFRIDHITPLMAETLTDVLNDIESISNNNSKYTSSKRALLVTNMLDTFLELEKEKHLFN